jgi:hypothetical protein
VSFDVPDHANSATAPDPDAPGVLHHAAALIEAHRHEPAVNAIGNPSLARDLRTLARQLQAQLPEPGPEETGLLLAELDQLAHGVGDPYEHHEQVLTPELFLAGSRYLVGYIERLGVYRADDGEDSPDARAADVIEIAKTYSARGLLLRYAEIRRVETDPAARGAEARGTGSDRPKH